MSKTTNKEFEFNRDRPGPRNSRIAQMLRVDHAGEYGAVQIYKGQRSVFGSLPHKSEITEMLQEMEDGEQHHLETFDTLLAERNIRPTLLAPIWNVAGFALGAGTALLGEKAAMACTEAVEDVIEKHYAEQEKELAPIAPDLAATISKFREEELEHKDTAEKLGALEAPAYPLLKAAIQTGCRIAIKLSEKI